MKKNKIMRLASALLVLTLMTTCAISSTFAKYTTSTTGNDSARVAKWGFTDTTSQIQLDNLFNKVYDTTVKAATDVIAPGTTGSATFGFTYGGDGTANAPEVAYTFKVDTTDSKCDPTIQNNTNIKWSLDGTLAPAVEGQNAAEGSWNALLAAIEKLDGDKEQYAPGQLPDGFTTGNNTHTVSWQWVFNTSDTADKNDTTMGNATALANVELHIAVTATQVD